MEGFEDIYDNHETRMRKYEINIRNGDWMEMRYLRNQTEDICKEALKHDVRALIFIEKQTPELCMFAIKRKSWALRFVREQTEEMCREAINKDPQNMFYVREKTLELCMMAIKQKNDLIHFVPQELVYGLVYEDWRLIDSLNNEEYWTDTPDEIYSVVIRSILHLPFE